MAVNRWRTLTAALAVVLSGTLLQAGGWAVITLQNVPEYLIVDAPATLVYTVRQHGHTPMNGLPGRIEARQGATFVRALANRLPPDGTYAATITLPAAGRWTLGVVSGSGLLGDRLIIDVPAIARNSQPPVHTGVERGRVLFEGKGCVICHAHNDFSGTRSVNLLSLSKKAYTSGAVRTLLSGILARPADSSFGTMPDLGLTGDEIDALAAFLGR